MKYEYRTSRDCEVSEVRGVVSMGGELRCDRENVFNDKGYTSMVSAIVVIMYAFMLTLSHTKLISRIYINIGISSSS